MEMAVIIIKSHHLLSPLSNPTLAQFKSVVTNIISIMIGHYAVYIEIKKKHRQIL